MLEWCVLHVSGRRLLSLEATHAKSATQLAFGLLHTNIIKYKCCAALSAELANDAKAKHVTYSVSSISIVMRPNT